jgi:hypothetical protein
VADEFVCHEGKVNSKPKAPPLKRVKDGAPLYNCVGVVKRHFSV